MKALIVDDERLGRAELKTLLAEIGGITIEGEASNGKEALEFLKKNKVDVVFLDMEMPEMTGLEVADEIDGDIEIIFVTAHEEYAIEAFDINASDYLLKPLNPQKLKKSVERLINRKEAKKELSKLSIHHKIFLKDGDKCWFLGLDKVRYFQSEGNYTKVLYDDQKPMVLRSLNNLESRLDSEFFFRASRKHIININHIKGMESWFNGGLVAIMSDNAKIEISRRQAVKFKQKYSL